jgi:hypothetical protein
MTDQPNAAGIDADPTGQPTGPTANQPDYKALYEAAQAEVASLKSEDWYKRFTGLQGLHQREQEKWKKGPVAPGCPQGRKRDPEKPRPLSWTPCTKPAWKR